ncbi:C40 family peptidase [Bacillus smithii]|uniref:C40 family peptidase n=1 Tax=Bacillus smithii TaxID=1479 RepID=UPI00077BE36C|nr:NlpC/P60 family protein [Bacillus smithii]
MQIAKQLLKKKLLLWLVPTLIPALLVLLMLFFAFTIIIENNQDDSSGSYCSSSGSINKSAWDQVFANAGVLSGKQDVFISVAEKQGIDPVLFAAISLHETGYGKSQAVIEKNNPGGLMGSGGLMVFPTLDAGIEAMGQTLHNRIVVDGLNTIEKLGSVYAPIGAANDPNNLNANWVPAVTQIAASLGGLTGGCTPGSTPALKGSEAFKAVMAEALKYQGQPYVFGGSNPTTGFDCSGLVQWCFKKIGINLPRTANEQYNVSKKISRSEAQPGDLVFFQGTYNAGVPITHVGIYVGNDQFYNSNGSGIEYSSLSNPYWAAHFAGFGRVMQ